jgi:putative thioredoxin
MAPDLAQVRSPAWRCLLDMLRGAPIFVDPGCLRGVCVTDTADVFDATQTNFEAEVLRASLTTPVLVDFRADWCAPCKSLGPVLEKLVAEHAGTLKLARVDVDAEQALAAMFGVQSLPTVMLVKDGRIADGFAGALPERELREFLARHVAPPVAEAPDEAAAAKPESPADAIVRLQQAIAAAPDQPELKLDLALAEVRAGNLEAAAAELASLPANLAADTRAQNVRNGIEFARLAAAAPSMEALRARITGDSGDLEAHDLLGVRLFQDGASAEALEQFLVILAANRTWNDGLARKRLVAAFGLIDDAELVGRYRRRMTSLLF